MTTTAKLIALLNTQVGYHEGHDSDGNWNNMQKYSPAVPGLEWSQGQAWCATFASWAYRTSGVKPGSFPVTASVGEAMNWYKDHGRWSEYPSVGAQIIMGEDKHTGIVIAVQADTVTTIEGNTNNQGSAQGDGVYVRTRTRRDPYVTGYGMPDFDKFDVPAPSTNGDTMNNDDARILWNYRNPSEKFDAYAFLLGTWHNVDSLMKAVADLSAKVDALSKKSA